MQQLILETARSAAISARTGTLIAFLAMLYLPMSTLAVRMQLLLSYFCVVLADNSGFFHSRPFSPCLSSTFRVTGEM